MKVPLEATHDDSVGSAVEGLNLEDWTTEMHSNSVAPNYDVVFDQNQAIELI